MYFKCILTLLINLHVFEMIIIKCPSSSKVLKNIFINSKTLLHTFINHINIKPGISSKLIDSLPVV